MKYAIALALIIFSTGCSTAGPFVTGISSDGKGGLIIQKGYAEFNYFTGVLGNKEAGESTIKISD
jgi:type IV secretion system protein VirB7